MLPRVLTRPVLLLRIEGAALLLVSALLYGDIGANWFAFVLLLLAPDVGMLGYLRGSRLGAASYNLFHTEALPAALGVFGFLVANGLALSLALIWLAHIGMDRLFGFGLKHPSAFKDTHLGRI